MHPNDASGAYWPLLQLTQGVVALASSSYLPAVQLLHDADDSGANWPEAQAWQAEAAAFG